MKYFMLLILVILLSCRQTTQVEDAPESFGTYKENKPELSCETIPDKFKSYKEAVEFIHNVDFAYEDPSDTDDSEWIHGADYYSCDEVTGFFIVVFGDKSYIFEDVPVEIWEGFLDALDYGKYYHEHIKGKYRMELSE